MMFILIFKKFPIGMYHLRRINLTLGGGGNGWNEKRLGWEMGTSVIKIK